MGNSLHDPETPEEAMRLALLYVFQSKEMTATAACRVIAALAQDGYALQPAAPAEGLEPLDGVDCDWDENGKCRCKPAAPAEGLDVERIAAFLHDEYGCRITCRGGRLADDRHPSHNEAYRGQAECLRAALTPEADR